MSIPESIKGHMLIQRSQEMVEELYCAPKEEVIMGSFLEQIVATEGEPDQRTKRQLQRLGKLKNLKGARNFFQNAGRPRSKKESTRTIVID